MEKKSKTSVSIDLKKVIKVHPIIVKEGQKVTIKK